MELLNITVVVQVLHFLCAYVLLRVFLWKPLVARIQQQDDEKLKLQKELDRQQQFIEQKEFEKERLWQDARRSFLVHAPDVMKISTVAHKVVREYEGIKSDIPAHMIHDLTKEIVEKVQE